MLVGRSEAHHQQRVTDAPTMLLRNERSRGALSPMARNAIVPAGVSFM